MKLYLSGRTVAKRLKVSHPTIGRRVRDGLLVPQAMADNGTFLFEPEYIDNIAKSAPLCKRQQNDLEKVA